MAIILVYPLILFIRYHKKLVSQMFTNSGCSLAECLGYAFKGRMPSCSHVFEILAVLYQGRQSTGVHSGRHPNFWPLWCPPTGA